MGSILAAFYIVDLKFLASQLFKMKLLLAVLLVTAVAAKPEIKFKNSCADPVVKVLSVDDEKSGACTLDSVLLLDFDTSVDTWSHELHGNFQRFLERHQSSTP